MKGLLIIVAAAALSGGMLLAQADQKSDEATAPATQPTTQPTTQPVNKMCPVMKDDEADPKVTYTYNGKAYAFCCKDCIAEFKRNPEKYANAK